MLTTTLAGLALLMLLVSVPLAAQVVPPNRLYGFRTPRTVKDERVWYPTNKVAGRNGLVFSIALFVSAVLSGLGVLGVSLVPALALLFVVGLVSTFVSASNIVNAVDKGGPLIDYRSSFEKSKSRDSQKDREALMKKLRKE
ncbi:MAG: SdpI family protein [Myxococcota bacterium]